MNAVRKTQGSARSLNSEIVDNFESLLRKLPETSPAMKCLTPQILGDIRKAWANRLQTRPDFQRSNDPVIDADYAAHVLISELGRRSGFMELFSDEYPKLTESLHLMAQGRILESYHMNAALRVAVGAKQEKTNLA